MADQQKAKEIKAQYERQWLAMNEVVAVGIGKAGNQMGIIISVTGNPDEVREEIADRINGVPITIQQTGPFKAQ